MNKWFGIILLMCHIVSAPAQTPMNLDSLLKLLPKAGKDTNSVLLYINIGQQYESNEPDIAKKYYRMANQVSKEIGYKQGEIKFIANYGFILNMEGHFDSSLALNKYAITIARKLGNPILLGKMLFNTGNSYRELGNYEDATRCYLEGGALMDRLGNDEISAQTNDMLQLLYKEMGLYEKAIQYGEKSLALSRKSNNPRFLESSLSNLAMSYTLTNQFGKARALFTEALQISKKTGDQHTEMTQMLNLANIHLQLDEYDKLRPYYERALILSRKLKSYTSESTALRGLGIYHMSQKEYPKAKSLLEQSLKIADTYHLKLEKRKILESLSSALFALHDMKSAERLLRLSSVIGDSILGETVHNKVVELEKKFETKQKEAQIKQLEAEKKLQSLSIKQKTTLNYFLMAGAVALLIISLLAYRNYSHKQKLQQQRIADLETEKQLTAAEAVLKGEEQERTRLAKDLHDGLGGMLSGIKFSFLTMKGNLVMTPDNAQAFERSMDMLDSSIKEMRRVAHNMMPEVLVKFGLDAALQDFCHDINQSGVLQVSYQSIGMENITIERNISITVYRIVQELIANTIKHASASSAIVQVSKEGDRMNVTVEDDGKGFDIAILQTARGIGWSNIQSRIAYLKGTLDVQSEPGNGTSVHIELSA